MNIQEKKQKVANLLISFNSLPEHEQDKLVCVAYGMELATKGGGLYGRSEDVADPIKTLV